jgi:diguanylate cyclase (GGDEF)-like protein
MVYHVGRGAGAGHVGLRLPISSSLSGLCVRQGTTLHCVDAATDGRVDREACRRVGAISMVCVPLAHADRVVGVLKVYDPRASAFSDEDVATLDLLSGVIAAHMAHASDFQEHCHDSRHDALTGLPNRRAFDERLATEIARVNRHGGLLTLCLLDLDRFKQVNDTRGHAAGDDVLRGVAGNLGQLRGEDSAYRLGGDEFALMLIEAAGLGAQRVTERIGHAIRADRACDGVGASWGVAHFRPGDDAAAMLARADAALYAAKRELAAS